MGQGFSSTAWIQHLGEGPSPFCGHSAATDSLPKPFTWSAFWNGTCLSEIAAFHDRAYLGQGSYAYTTLFCLITFSLQSPGSQLRGHLCTLSSVRSIILSVDGPHQRRRPNLRNERIIPIVSSCRWGKTYLWNKNYHCQQAVLYFKDFIMMIKIVVGKLVNIYCTFNVT